MTVTGKGFMFVLLAGFLPVFFLGACGYKTDPVAPQQVVPKAIADLSYELSDKGVTLSWTYPDQTVTGDDLTELEGFSVQRAVIPAEAYCETCPIPFGEPESLPGGGVPKEGKRSGSYEDTLLRQGHMYFYKIRARTGWWAESADSNVVSFLWDTPPAPPANVRVESGDGSVTLRWDAVNTLLGGKESTAPVKYQVFRSAGGGSFAPVGKLVTATSLTDREVGNGRTYNYKVQAVAVHAKGSIGGGMSEVVSAAPRDMTPPKAPGDVRVLRVADGVKVFWSPVAGDDIAKYRVYRSLAGGKRELVGEVSAEFSLLLDRKAPAGNNGSVSYMVTTMDKNGNESPVSGTVPLQE